MATDFDKMYARLMERKKKRESKTVERESKLKLKASTGSTRNFKRKVETDLTTEQQPKRVREEVFEEIKVDTQPEGDVIELFESEETIENEKICRFIVFNVATDQDQWQNPVVPAPKLLLPRQRINESSVF